MPLAFPEEVGNASGSRSVRFAPPVRACAGPPLPSAAQRRGRPLPPRTIFRHGGCSAEGWD
eukprot:4407101-Alexandrium_andersonii.AAC.1